MPLRRRPGPHPEPPPDLAKRSLPAKSVPATMRWFRIHDIRQNALFFGTSGLNRFDAPEKEYGVLYVGREAACAFIETFGHATGTNFVTEKQLKKCGMSLIEANRELRLVDLTGTGLAHLGADARLSTGDIALAQRWSLAFYQHPEKPDGILYRARHDPSCFAAAIFERGQEVFQESPLGSLLAPQHKRRLARLLNKYRFALLPG